MSIEYTDIDFPIRFNQRSNLVLTDVDKTIQDNIRNAVMVSKYGVPLSTIGSNFAEIPFDPNDTATAEILSEEVVDSIEQGEHRVLLNGTPRVVSDESETKLSLVFDYVLKYKTDGWKSIVLGLPAFLTDVRR